MVVRHCPVRCDLIVAFVIVFYSPGGILVTVWEQIAAPRVLGHRLPLLVVAPVASTLESEVEVPDGLAGLKSQGQGRVPHPVAGEAIRPSCQAVFRWWDVIPVITAWQCCVVCNTLGVTMSNNSLNHL
jgi:hypothetical protein